jgi:acyl CoA:acetate/3-ketoacid CoA transferase alpha subunit/acyl CoA:acetate/3-ketoacid CoA transferase beta subunit
VLKSVFFFKDLEYRLNKIQDESIDKRTTLPGAIKETLKAQMQLHFACISALPYSSIREIIRQTSEKKLQFQVISLGSASQIQMLVAEGLVSKLITSYVGDVYPRPGISPVFQRAFDDGLEIEQWSLMVISLRLYAGALGLKFIPTRSLIGSTMASDNQDSYKIISNPFNSTQDVAIVEELVPDVSFIHVWAADQLGNAIICPPYSENLWGCFASKKVIVTSEKMLSVDAIRKLANSQQCLTLPGGIVDFVIESPFGGHPGPNYGPQGAGYDIDLEYLIEFRKSAKDSEELSSWMKEWIYNTDQESYLNKVGIERLTTNSGHLDESYWKWVVTDKRHLIQVDQPATPIENMIWVATEIIKDRAIKGEYLTILAGQGASNLAAWLAAYSLNEAGQNINLLAEAGFYGYQPKPASPYIFEFNNLRSSTAILDSITSLGAVLHRTKSIGVLGAGQIDQFGNINSTRVESFILFGSGGANDTGSYAREIIVLIPLKAGRFPPKVPYITVPGENISVCVTTKAIFEKNEDNSFVLTGYIGEESNKEQILEEIRHIISWDLQIKRPLSQFKPPSTEWLRFLRAFDPDRYFLGRFS